MTNQTCSQAKVLSVPLYHNHRPYPVYQLKYCLYHRITICTPANVLSVSLYHHHWPHPVHKLHTITTTDRILYISWSTVFITVSQSVHQPTYCLYHCITITEPILYTSQSTVCIIVSKSQTPTTAHAKVVSITASQSQTPSCTQAKVLSVSLYHNDRPHPVHKPKYCLYHCMYHNDKPNLFTSQSTVCITVSQWQTPTCSQVKVVSISQLQTNPVPKPRYCLYHCITITDPNLFTSQSTVCIIVS